LADAGASAVSGLRSRAMNNPRAVGEVNKLAKVAFCVAPKLKDFDTAANRMHNHPIGERVLTLPAWVTKVLRRIRDRATVREVMFTLKARRELAALDLELDEDDACDILAKMAAADSAGRLKSEQTGEWMYVFKPQVSGAVLYVKLMIRSNCVIVSFHEDAPDK